MDKDLMGFCRIHKNLKNLFYYHQSALLDRDLPEARFGLLEYGRLTLIYCQAEEQFLIPLYRERADIRPGGAVENFTGEHSKIKMFLKRLEDKLSLLESSDHFSKDLIGLLDDETHYKDLMEHHNQREERFLFPELERVANEEEKQWLLDKIRNCVNRVLKK